MVYKPDLGPEDKNRKSLRIFNNDTANVFSEFEKLTNESWLAIASNLFFAGFVYDTISDVNPKSFQFM